MSRDERGPTPQGASTPGRPLPRAERERRARILSAATELFETRGVSETSRRDIAIAADVATRSVTSWTDSRTDALARVVESLPFPPTSQRIQQAAAEGSPMSTILSAARDAFGAPASVWDVIELQAVALAPFDESLATVVRERMALRWDAARTVVRRLRGEGAVDATIDDDAATLLVIAVGAGLALLEGLTPRTTDAEAWSRLTARLLESLAAADPPELEYDGPTRPMRVRVVAPDSPAATARIMRVLALMRVDVVSLFTHAQEDDTQLVDMIVSAPATMDRDTLHQALATVAHRTSIRRGVEEDEDDLVARILDAAAGLIAHPQRAPRAAADLVMADSWTVERATEGEDASPHVMRLQWTPDHHVVLRREGAPFVAVERSRASALLRLIEAMATAPAGAGGFGWVEHLRDGSRVEIRLARPEDAEDVEEMHTRSSEDTRYQRYFAPMNDWREDQLNRISGGHRGATLVVEDTSGAVVGLGNLFPEHPGDADSAEIAVIVEDDWQGRGLGTLLLGHLVELAKRQHFTTLVALVLATNTGMIRLLERLGLTWTKETDPDLGPGIVRMTASLA